MKAKMLSLAIMVMIALSSCGIAYSRWTDSVNIVGTVTTGRWDAACLEISKTLNGSFTDPTTGKEIPDPTNLIHIGSGASSKIITFESADLDPLCPVTPSEFPTLFQLIIVVRNCGDAELTNVMVYDRIGPGIGPKNVSTSVLWTNVTNPSGFTKYFLTWSIGTLKAGEEAKLVIWLATEPNPQGAYEPTSGDNGDWQYLEVNGEMDHKTGARVYADTLDQTLTAVTSNITLYISDDGSPGNRVGIISSPLLPFTTTASVHYPP